MNATTPTLDRDAFNEVVSEAWDDFVRYAKRLVQNRTLPHQAVNTCDAEDVVQLALTKAWENRATYKGTGPVKHWLFVYVYWTHRQRRFVQATCKVRLRLLQGHVERLASPSSEDSIEKVDLREWADTLIGQLRRENHRRTFTLVYREGCTPQEAARIRGVSRQCVHQHLQQGYERLRARASVA